jgi:hypothetical protein
LEDCGSGAADRWLAPDMDCCGSRSKPSANATKINSAEHFCIKRMKISPSYRYFPQCVVDAMGVIYCTV